MFEFVGQNSPNPDKTVYPNDYNNFSPGCRFCVECSVVW